MILVTGDQLEGMLVTIWEQFQAGNLSVFIDRDGKGQWQAGAGGTKMFRSSRPFTCSAYFQ
jgi:hypothetical protein